MALTYEWPIVVFFPSQFSNTVRLVGVFTWVLVLFSLLGRRKGRARKLHPAILVPVLLMAWALAASIGRPVNQQELWFFAGIVLPAWLIPFITTARLNIRHVTYAALAFDVCVLTGVGSDVNPLVAGHLAWIAAVGLILADLPRLTKAVGAFICVAALVQVLLGGAGLGPFVGVGAASLGLAASRAQSVPKSRWALRISTRAPGRLAILVVAGLVAAFLVSSIHKESVNQARVSNTQIRAEAWSQVARGSLLGEGLSTLVARQPGTPDVTLVYSHNFLVDSFRVAGLGGLLLVAAFVCYALATAWRRADPLLPLYGGVVASFLTSGGVFFGSAFWVALACALHAAGRIYPGAQGGAAEKADHNSSSPLVTVRRRASSPP